MVKLIQPYAIRASERRATWEIYQEMYWALHNGYRTFFEVRTNIRTNLYSTDKFITKIISVFVVLVALKIHLLQ